MNRQIGATVVAGTALHRLEEYFWPDGFRRNIWMVVDTARDPRIYSLLRELHLEHYCLYRGPLPRALEEAAPFLVQLDYDDPEMRQFLSQAWGKSWGIFFRCGALAESLRRHLREFLIVRDPDGKRLVFRYYDPRVLRIFLPTCTADELRTLFGPIDLFWTEDEHPDGVVEFGHDDSGLVATRRRLPGSGGL